MADLGLLLQQGIQDTEGRAVVRRNPTKGFQLLRRAADRGDSSAAFSLGYAYDTGVGTLRSRDHALRWYRRAWRKGYSLAASNIATIYRDEGKRRLAFQWWRRSQSLGDGDAAVDVGYCYQYGIGARRNYVLAKHMYKLAIASEYITAYGREEAMYHLAIAHLDEGKASRAIPLLARAIADDDFTGAASLLEQIRSRSRIRPCRCRRGLAKGLPGHAVCQRHSRSKRAPA